MKILHTSDLHIGANRRIPEYIKRYAVMLEEILFIAKERRVQAMIIAGDIYDRKNTTPDEQHLAMKWFLELDQLNIPVILCSGNHDQLTTTQTALASFKLLETYEKFKNISVVESIKTIRLKNLKTDALCIPDCNDPDFKKYTKAFLKRSKARYKILVTHGMFKGAIDKKPQGKLTFSRGANVKDISSKFTYTALGDIHTFQRLAPKVFYSGSPAQHNFGESLPKGVLIVDLKNPDKPELVKLKRPKKFKIITTIPEEWPKGYLSVRVPRDQMPATLPINALHSCPLGDAQKIRKKIQHSLGDFDPLEYLDYFLRTKETVKADRVQCYQLLEKLDPGLFARKKKVSHEQK